MSELHAMSIDDVEQANRALDAWQNAEREMYRRLKSKPP